MYASDHGEQAAAARNRAGFWPRAAWLFAAGLIVAMVCIAFLQFRLPGHGFTYVFDFGGTIGLPVLPEVASSAVYIHEGVPGYDGQMYAQVALRPWGNDPDLARAIDNPPYRARRILMEWLAWLIGAGNPWAVLNVQACLNLGFWLVLSVVLLRWFPPSGGVPSLLRWSGVLLSSGMLSSMRHALTDGPSLCVVAIAMACAESGRTWMSSAVGALAGLTRETTVVVGAALLPGRLRDLRGWLRVAGQGLVIVVPLALWMWHLRGLGSASAYEHSGVSNFTWPFAGYVGRWRELLAAITDQGAQKTEVLVLLAHVGLTVNMVWIILHPRWSSVWWRLGAVHVLLLAVLNTQVWEGYPGAASRVLLPLLLAFNVLAPVGRRGLVWVIAGNLSVFSGMLEMSGPPQPIWTVQGAEQVSGGFGRKAAIWVEEVSGFHVLEGRGTNTWQWTSGDAAVRLHNDSGSTVRATLAVEFRCLAPRKVAIQVGGTTLWTGDAGREDHVAKTEPFALPPGVTEVQLLASPAEATPAAGGRVVALRIFSLDVQVVDEKRP